MADFFSNLMGQALGTAAEVRPLLPPRFSPWPSLAAASSLAQPPAAVDEPARADAAAFAPPLIAPHPPAIDTPLPTLRQMGRVGPAAGHAIEPDVPTALQDTRERAGSERGDIRQDRARTIGPALDDALASAPPAAPASSPTPPVIQAEADSEADGAVTASPARRGASGERPAKGVATTGRDQAVLPLPRPAPRPAANQEPATSSARLADSPASIARLLRSGQAAHVEAQPEPVEGGHAEPAPAPLTVQPAAPVRAPVVQRQQATPAGQPVAPPAPQPIPAPAPDLPVSTQARATPTMTAPALATGSVEPAPPAGRAVPGWGEPTIVPAPEPAPVEMGPTPAPEAVAILRPPPVRAEVGAPEPAPTVRVTIGRVVVRASPAEERPPSRRVELPRPPLSLEEYLQGRQGDGR